MQTQLTLKLKPQLDDLNKAVSKIKKSLEIDLSEGISKAISNTAQGIKGNLGLKNLFSKEVSELNASLRNAANTRLTFQMEKNMEKMKSGVAQIASTGIAAYGTIGKVMRDSMHFEESFADVKKVLDGATNADKLKEGVLEMSTWIGFSANELNKIAYSAGQMGLKGEKNILKFTELTAKMGIAFDSSSEQAGKSMSKMLNVFELNLDEVESLGDAINNLANNTNAEAMDIVDVLGRIGGSAKDFGLTAKQTAALSDSFIALGQSPEIAGTAIKNMLGRLNSGKKAVSEWFENMGLDYEEWAEFKMKSPEEALRSFLGKLGELEGREKTIAISDMFGLENSDKISTLAGALQNYDKAIGLNKLDYKGSMEEEYKARASTTAFELNKLNAQLNKISVTVGDMLLPVVKSLAESVNEFLKPLSEWVKNNEGLIKKIFWGISGLMAFKIVTIGVQMALSALSIIIYPLQKVFILLRYSVMGSSVALISNRLALIYSAVATKAHTLATMGANLATKAWGVSVQWFSKIFKISMWSVRGALIATGIGALIAGLGVAISYVMENWESIAPRLVAVWEWVKDKISPIIEWFSSIFGFISEGIDNLLGGAGASEGLGVSALNTQGLVDSTIDKQMQGAQSFYNAQNRQINDNKTIYITTGANANDVARAIASNSYTYED